MSPTGAGYNLPANRRRSRPRFSVQLPLAYAGDVTADGKRFLNILNEGANAPALATVVTNWQAVLAR